MLKSVVCFLVCFIFNRKVFYKPSKRYGSAEEPAVVTVGTNRAVRFAASDTNIMQERLMAEPVFRIDG